MPDPWRLVPGQFGLNSNATMYEKATPGNHLSIEGAARYMTRLEDDICYLVDQLRLTGLTFAGGRAREIIIKYAET